ncbi:terminase family protein [Salarchaeum sp. III]|uniref:terminase large subunit domain-containing protein n=1 Tax=Salarchaeum sp. III TaxID=3107927 RepID=UPI002ED93054
MSATLIDLAERKPLAHPAVASVRLFDYSIAPGDHLLEFYDALWKAVDEDFPHAPTRVARLLPRGHGKTESGGVVFPAWLLLRHPEVRVAVLSKTRGLAAERTEKVVDVVETFAPEFGVEIAESSRTQLTTGANDHKEASIAPYGLESQLTGKHFDIIIFDDVADWENQRTATQRRNVRSYFADYVDNLPSNDSVLPNGPVQVVIGTRKHEEDIYATNILGDKRWDTRVYKAIAEEDWPLVEQRAWKIRGQDGEVYDDVSELPDDVSIANQGVIPEADIDVLWPDLQPPEALLYDIVTGDDSSVIWRRENQQDPSALAGEVFSSDWLTYVDDLPNPASSYRWVGGMDIGVVEDVQAAAQADSDFSAVAVIATDPSSSRGYVVHLTRERGLSTKGNADWAASEFRDVAGEFGIEYGEILVETNKAPGVAQRLRDNTSLPARGVESTSSKEGRIHDLSAEFESSDLRILGAPSEERWRDWEVKEWLRFPNAAHDDRLDAIELANRATQGGEVKQVGSMRDLL